MKKTLKLMMIIGVGLFLGYAYSVAQDVSVFHPEDDTTDENLPVAQTQANQAKENKVSTVLRITPSYWVEK